VKKGEKVENREKRMFRGPEYELEPPRNTTSSSPVSKWEMVTNAREGEGERGTLTLAFVRKTQRGG